MNKKTTQKNNKKRRKPLSKGVLLTIKVCLAVIILIGTIGVGLLAGVTVGCVITTKPLTEEELYTSDHVTKIYDKDGAVMLSLTGESATNRQWVDIEKVPKHLQNAFIAIEDSRFRTHNGVDLKRTMSAVLGFFVSDSGSHGGSTITQQVVKNVTGDDSRSVPRKIREQWRAIQLEQDLEKDDILELYVNIIYFANDSYGIQVAAKTYFDKNAEDLTLAECAFLAGIPNSPGRYNPATTTGRKNAYKRQIIILDAMLEQECITQEEYIEAIQTRLEFKIDKNNEDSSAPDPDVYTYFEDAVIKQVRNDLMELGYSKAQANNLIYNSGLQIYTTQDSDIQAIVDDVYCNDAYFKINIDRDPEDCSQSGITIIDHSTGQIVAMYGGYGKKTQSLTYNRATDIERQPGSSIKPILVYAPLIDQGKLTAGTPLDEMPAHLDVQNPDRIWPSNWDKKVHGMMTARYALNMSYNIPAATWFKDNINVCLEYLKASGIDRTNEAYVSTALGGLNKGVSPTELAAAYAVIANGGIYYEPTVYTKVCDRSGNVLLDNTAKSGSLVYKKPTTTTIATSMLESVIYDSRSTGKTAQMKKKDGTVIPAAGKTGSTNELKDYWFAGFTGYYTAAVWYGYDNETSINEKLEGGTHMIIWKAIMQRIHEDLEIKDFTESPETVKVEICTCTGKRATDLCKKDPRAEHWVYEEIFVKGTEPGEDEFCDVHQKVYICKNARDKYGKYYLAHGGCTNKELVTGTLRETLPEDIDTYDETLIPTDWTYELSHEYCPICTVVIEPPEDEVPETPDEPSEETPDVPPTETPEMPETPEEPDTSDEPEISEDPETQETPSPEIIQ